MVAGRRQVSAGPPWGSAAEEIDDGLTVLLGCLDAGYVTAAREHDELGSGDGAGNRLGLGGIAAHRAIASGPQFPLAMAMPRSCSGCGLTTARPGPASTPYACS
jgi:hypothetical protein